MITHIRDDEIGPSQENSTGDGVNQAVNSLDAQNPAPPPIPTQGSSDVSRTASRLRRAAEALRWFLLDQWFLVVFCILILISSQVQVASSQESLKGTVIDYLAVAIIFFINGCTLPTKVLLKSVLRWKVQIYSQLQSYLMTSAIVFGIVSACASNPDFMDPALLVGLIIWGCLPTTYANVTVLLPLALTIEKNFFKCDHDNEIPRQYSSDHCAVYHWELARSIPIPYINQDVYINRSLVH